ncbi:FAD:protein FMN transferase [bacterium AH-315-O15]|nr:FAD:protein FMN transferase [bacterium AH-315-O15]
MRRVALKRVALIVLAGCATLSAQDAPAVFVSRDVYLMGTRARLSTYAATRDSGLATLESALEVIEDAEEELSTWRQLSQISALNRHPVDEPWTATPRLCRMFRDVWEWHRATDGAFDPAIGRLLAAWDIHGEGVVPSSKTRARALASSGMALLAFDRGRCTLTRRADVAIDVGAFGKGEALDRVAAALGDGPWMIDIGGQIAIGGRVPRAGAWPIAIADPHQRDRPVVHVKMTTGSISTSAGSERDLVVKRERVGHVLDPRTGRPATFDGSVTVWHERSIAADALSTALYVMGPEDGLRWAEARGVAACYLIPERGALRVEMTHAFRRLLPSAATGRP